jgi:hypothetical protein
MDYKTAWNKYVETIQSSAYMQRLTLANEEKLFKAGFEYARNNEKLYTEKAKQFLESKQEEHFNKFDVYADTNSKIAEWMEEYARNFKVDKLEIIDHTPNGEGRAYIKRGDITGEIQLQDEGKSFKIFLK